MLIVVWLPDHSLPSAAPGEPGSPPIFSNPRLFYAGFAICRRSACYRELTMKRSVALTCLLAAAAAGIALPGSAGAQQASAIAGVWTLNKALSEMPHEIGFEVPWLPSASGGASSGSSGSNGGGGRGRRGSGGGGRGGGGSFYAPRESYDDAKRMQLLTTEARNPPARLMVVDNASTVTFTNELGQSRTLHPDGKEEPIEIETVPFQVT